MTTEQALLLAVTALAGTIAFLFKFYSGRLALADDARSKRDEEISKERIEWAKERTRMESMELSLRAEYEEKHRSLIETQAKIMQAIYDAGREHENRCRREYAQNMEVVAAKVTEATEKIGAVLDKMLDRVLGTRRLHGKAD